jgi:hypothetical protein
MKVLKIFKLLTAALFIMLSATDQSLAQNANETKVEHKDYNQVKKDRKARFQSGLNLSDKQIIELEKLNSDAKIERGRFHDKVKAEKKAMQENHDNKLRSILDEKQYYGMKSKVRKMHGKHNGKNKNRKHRKIDKKSSDGRHSREEGTRD